MIFSSYTDIKTKNSNMKIIVLSNTKYKENDVIYDAISETESVSFKAYRGQDNKSEYVWLNNIMTIADVEFADRRYKYPTLKEAKLISSSIGGGDPLEYLYTLSALSEVTTKMFQPEERHIVFNELEAVITALKSKKDYLLLNLLYIAKAIKLSGAELEVNKCVFCGSTHDIVSFSFSDGGFVCRNCISNSEPTNLSTNQMRLIRYIFKSPDYSCIASEKYTKEDKIEVTKALVEFISDYLGVVINSVSNLYI